MPSSVIRRFEYSNARDLVITFTTGRRYRYVEVPEEVVLKFRGAFSNGEYFNRHIRNRFECVEMERADEGKTA